LKLSLLILFIVQFSCLNSQNYRIKQKDKLYGILDSNNKVIIPYEYQNIFKRDDNYVVYKNDKWGILNSNFEFLIDTNQDDIDIFEYSTMNSDYLITKKNDRSYIINKYGKILNSKPYKDIVKIKNNHNFVVLDSNKIFVIDSNNAILSKKYSNIKNNYQNRSLVCNYFIDTIPNRIKYYIPEDLIICGGENLYFNIEKKQIGRYGFVDNNYKEIIPLKYNYATHFYGNQLAMVMKLKNNKSKFGYIDTNGNEIIPIKYNQISIIYHNIIVAKLKNKYILLNTQNKQILQYKFDTIFYNYSFYKAIYKDKYGIIDTNGKIAIPFEYFYIGRFEDELLNASDMNNCWGYLDLKNNIKIPFEYDGCFPFYGGIAKVYKDNKTGFIDTLGKIVIPIMYDGTALYFNENKLKVRLNNKKLYIDINNKCIQDCE